jgi:hypothetical protein
VKQNLEQLIEALAERQQTADRRLSELGALVEALEARIAELTRVAPPAVLPAAALPKAAQATPAIAAKAEVTPEMIVILAAAATAYLGKNVRVRSAKMLQSPYEIVNPWAQHGRVMIQVSHSLRGRR